jgi:hypothetical protein
MQLWARASGNASTAIGGYQIIYKTLRSLKQGLGLSGSERFTPELQDHLADALLQRRGLNEYREGKISKRQFALGLAQEWASLPDPATGRSVYAGDGLNAASARPRDVYGAMGLSVPDEAPKPAVVPAPISPAYASIPDVDDQGRAGQRQKFAEWNPDPIGNNATYQAELAPNLQKVIELAHKYSPVQFVVGSGKRDEAQQRKAIQWGWSKTIDSDHLKGSAADLWPIKADKVRFDPADQKLIIKAMRKAAKELGVKLDFGERFGDLPHFALKSR